MRITESIINNKIDHLAKLLNVGTKCWNRVEGRNTAIINDISLYRCLGVWAVHQMVNEGGGCRVIVSGSTGRELANAIDNYRNGLYDGKESAA